MPKNNSVHMLRKGGLISQSGGRAAGPRNHIPRRNIEEKNTPGQLKRLRPAGRKFLGGGPPEKKEGKASSSRASVTRRRESCSQKDWKFRSLRSEGGARLLERRSDAFHAITLHRQHTLAEGRKVRPSLCKGRAKGDHRFREIAAPINKKG